MEREALPLMRELGLTQQDVVFLGDVQVRQQDEIGRGSDAAVYCLKWQGIDIALKVLHPILIEPGVQDRERKIQSFGQEVFRLSRIHHPNLCQLLGIARVGRNAALALELLTSTLEELSIGEDREDGLKLIGYLCDTSAGIRYLHVRGILHRDLAPKNVMIKNGVAKVCDFGVAKFVRLASPRQQQQQAQGSRMAMTRCPGTLAFMPPEALVEQPEYDRPLDVFSLGVTLLAVLAGVMPGIDLINSPAVVVVREANGRETRQVIAETRRRAAYLQRLADEHPLKALILRCLSNEPSERPTAEEVHEEMKRVLQLFTSLSSPHLSNVPPAVVRRLDSISQQLTQQATSITALSTRSDTLEEQLTAITDNQTTTQQQLTALTNNQTTSQQQLTETQQQLTAITNNQTTSQQQLTRTQQQLTETQQQLTALTNNQTTSQQQLTRTQQQLTTITNNQTTSQQQLTRTQQQLAAITNNQTTAQQQLTATQQQLTATQQQVSTMRNEQTKTNHRMQSLSDSNQRLEQQSSDQYTQTSQQISSLDDHISSISGQLSRMSPSAHQASASSPITSRASLSSSASATAAGSATAPSVPASAPITSRLSRSSSASATAATSATATRAEATAAENTRTSVARRACHVLPAMPTPRQIKNIRRRRMWNKLSSPQQDKYAELAVYSNKLVAVLYDGSFVSEINQTTDLQTWHGIDLPHHYKKVSEPSLASHDGKLYMYCTVQITGDTQDRRVILQYSETEQGVACGQWTVLLDVPYHNHDRCTMHVCDDAISLFGGFVDLVSHSHVSTYSLVSKQWRSSNHDSASRSLPLLPKPSTHASLVKLTNSMYIVGGPAACYLKNHDGGWVTSNPPHGIMLAHAAACALSDHSMVICENGESGTARCVVYDTLSGQVYPLPDHPWSVFTPSITLLGSNLVFMPNNMFGTDGIYTLDMSV